MNIDELELSVRAVNCLRSLGIETLEQLLETDKDRLLSAKGMGSRTYHEIKDALILFDKHQGYKEQDLQQVRRQIAQLREREKELEQEAAGAGALADKVARFVREKLCRK